MVRVLVAGAEGRVGQVMVAGLSQQAGLTVVGGFDRGDLHRLDELLARADVLVDFTVADAARELLPRAIRAGVRPVSGTTGLPDEFYTELDRLAREQGIGAFTASNFAVGAVLMMHFSRLAARFMDSAEVIEMHHDKKVDAPSGTAITTARLIREARGEDLPDPEVHKHTLPGARGAAEGGVRIHSVRLPGLVAHQEVVFGALGQVLTIRHDAPGREAYVPGVALAARAVMEHVGLVRGLDALMGLTQD